VEPLPMVLLAHGGPWGRDVYGYHADHHFQLLCHQRVAKRAHSRPVPARPIEACDKAEFDGIAAGEKDDRNSRGCSLGRESRAAGDCQDHHHLLPPWLGQTDEDVRRGELFDEP